MILASLYSVLNEKQNVYIAIIELLAIMLAIDCRWLCYIENIFEIIIIDGFDCNSTALVVLV